MPTTFLDLPGELHNMIYDLYLTSHKRAALLIIHPHSPPEGTYLLPALSRVSRQIRQEFLSIWGPVNTCHARTLKVFVHNLELEPLLKFLIDHANNVRTNHFTDVQLVFRFTDAVQIAKQQGEKDVAWFWQRLNFWEVTGRLRPFTYRMLSYSRWGRRLPPVTSHKAIIDWQSLGGKGVRSRSTVLFAPSPRLFGNIVRRAEEAVQVQRRPAETKKQERAFRTWLKLGLKKAEHRPRGCGRMWR